MQSPEALDRRLRQVGVQLIDEEAAAVPRSERGKYLPCRVIASKRDPLLPPHEAGYLIVEVVDKSVGDTKALREALIATRPGEKVRLRVRRNPFLTDDSKWWEMTVLFRMPE